MEASEDRRVDCWPIGVVIPFALAIFFHVYEETIGRYGFGVQRHVLVSVGHTTSAGIRRAPRTGCLRVLSPRDLVSSGFDITLDRTWCRTCAGLVREFAPHRGGKVTDTTRLLAVPRC